jgi:Uma2 family endonuclease
VEAKVRDYLEAGSRLVWVVYPEIRAARIWRADGTTQLVDEDGSLTGEDLLPGFALTLAEVFA